MLAIRNTEYSHKENGGFVYHCGYDIFNNNKIRKKGFIHVNKLGDNDDDGKNYNTNHYSLQMIIAVGFKVNSERAVQFRKWVNQIASEYTIKLVQDSVYTLDNYIKR